MTAIAYKDGIMCADTAMWMGSQIPYHMKKIARVNGMLVAAAGNDALMLRFRQWVIDGMEGEFDRRGLSDHITFDGIIVMPGNQVLRVGEIGPPICYDAKFHAIGGCQAMLIGALAAGASARMAIDIAIAYSDSAAGGVQIEELHPTDEIFGDILGKTSIAA